MQVIMIMMKVYGRIWLFNCGIYPNNVYLKILTILHFTILLIYNLILTCCCNYFVFPNSYFNFGQDPWQHPHQVPLHLQMLLRELRQGRLHKVPGSED